MSLEMPTREADSRCSRIAAAALAAFGLAVWMNSAWLSDDAFITFRTVANVWAGYGLRWNIIERVQTYTHPLWLAALTLGYGVSREVYWSTLVLSLLCTVGAVYLLWRHVARAALVAALTLALLAGSRAFVEYSSSGLENPLTHLLIVLFWIQLSTNGLLAQTTLFSLCALTRMDATLMIAPSLGLSVWKGWTPRSLRDLAAGLSPLVAWECFSVFYYGFPWPNTAYAKLATQIPARELIAQGLRYLADSLSRDYITLPAVLVAIVFALRRGTRNGAMAAGLLLQLAYIVWVGGDFMTGRFLSAAFVLSVCFLGSIVRPTHSAGWLCAGVLGLGFLAPGSPLRLWTRPQSGAVPLVQFGGIADERAFYYPSTGLVPVLSGARPTDFPWAQVGISLQRARDIVVTDHIGMIGFYAGPAPHIVDVLALSDPLLARLPARPGWRIGHFYRDVPAGYEDSLRQCLQRLFPNRRVFPTDVTCLDFDGATNRIADPALLAYYEVLRTATQGPLTSGRRMSAIVRLNLGLIGPHSPARLDMPDPSTK